jgi:NADH:ubiquinone reductase (H+-translocating)
VLQYRRLRISGFFAWLGWIMVHIAVLVQWRNRYAVTMEWAWYYLGDRPGVRLITGHDDPKCAKP